MRCQKGGRISRREAVQAAQAAQAAWQSRGAKSLPLMPPTCFTLYHLGNLRATVRATVHTISKAALRSAAAGHVRPSHLMQQQAGSLVEASRSRLLMRQRDTWRLRTSRRWMLPWCLSEVRRHSWRSGILLSRGSGLP